MLLRESKIVLTPDEAQPYKVVLDHETKGVVEYPVSTIREGEALIRKNLPTPLPPKADAWNDRTGKPTKASTEESQSKLPLAPG